VTRLAGLVVLALVLTACASLEVEQTPSTDHRAVSTVPAVKATTTTVEQTTTTTTTPVFVLSGVVIDGKGHPVANVTVTSGDVAVQTGPGGWFRLLVAEPADIETSKPGWEPATASWDEDAAPFTMELQQTKVRGLRVSAGAAADDEIYESLLELAKNTAVNAFVFDTKQEGGEVVYDTTVDAAHQIGAVNPWYDPAGRLRQAKERGIYAITRIVTFEDSFRAKSHPDEKLAGSWIDPRSGTAQDYNISLAVEACRLGFDEIQFDYVRFPAGRTVSVSGQLDMSEESRVAAIESFLESARSALQPLGCAVSADIFGIVVAVQDDQGLGQRPEELSRQVGAISPMVYPSHYENGWLGFPDPNDYPYEVTADAIDDALPRLADGVELRPWLQAFWWNASQIREAIQAAEDRDVGWVLWNVRSNFSADALPTDAEVGE